MVTLFEKKSRNFSNKNLLYLMGGTWFNKSMFDLNIDNNFSDCLNDEGINTYSLDLESIDIENTEEEIGNLYYKNKQNAIKCIKENNINIILSYSSGIFLLTDLLFNEKIKFDKIILLDPCLGAINSKQIIDDDKMILRKKDLINDLPKNNVTIDNIVLEKYLYSIFGEKEEKIFPSYPYKNGYCRVLPSIFKKLINDKIDFKVFFTKNAKKENIDLIPDDKKYIFKNNSHWIMIEKERKLLAEKINEYISL